MKTDIAFFVCYYTLALILVIGIICRVILGMVREWSTG